MPRIAVKETKVFKFGELSERAKQRVLGWYATDGMYDSWWDATYEDAKTCFAFCGIRINKIFFSGFWSQGAGACFEGEWHAGNVKPGALNYGSADKELYRIAEGFEKLAKNYPGATFTVKHQGYYHHKFCTDFTVGFLDDPIDEMQYDSPEWKARNTKLQEAEKELIELARDAMEWIYRTLEKEYEYQTSEEVVAETAEANGWEFTEEGKLYC